MIDHIANEWEIDKNTQKKSENFCV